MAKNKDKSADQDEEGWFEEKPAQEFVKCDRCKRRQRDDEEFVTVTDENGDSKLVCEQCSENYPKEAA